MDEKNLPVNRSISIQSKQSRTTEGKELIPEVEKAEAEVPEAEEQEIDVLLMWAGYFPMCHPE